MLTALDVATLQRTRTYPAVSLLCPTDRDEARTRVRLGALARRAHDRLTAEFGPDAPEVALLDDQLERVLRDEALTRSLEERPPALAVYATADEGCSVSVPEPVRERVVVDETFATRDLVRALLRSPSFHVLVLSSQVTRLYDGGLHGMHEAHGGGFPLSRPGADVDDHDRRPHRDRSDARDVALARFVRDVDEVFGPWSAADPKPLLVVGSARRVSAYATRSAHRQSIAETVAWGKEQPRPSELLTVLRPRFETLLAQSQADALLALDDAVHRRRFSSGLDEVWALATEGRGDLLVVEEGFEQAARLDPETGQLVVADDPEAPGVIDDVVDEVIEAVLASRGRVVFVPDGTLARWDRLAMVLRH